MQRSENGYIPVGANDRMGGSEGWADAERIGYRVFG